MNIFTQLIGILNSIPIAGEENMQKMQYVFQTLHRMEAASKEENEDG